MKPIVTRHARRRFVAVRDEQGVPHVTAGSWRSALYALGYLHALDRPTQMLFARAVASGRSASEIADKPELVETDRFFRRAGLYRHLDREVRALDDETFWALTAYCEGVNDGLKDSGRSLPMWATGFVASLWNQEAVLLVGQLLAYGGLVVAQQQNERILVDLIKSGIADDKLRELFHPALNHVDFELLRRVHLASQLSDNALELITDLPRLAGSNAWAVASWRSATGGALLACDPHLEVNRLPAIWYEVVLRWGERYVLGASLPGCPLFAVGRTERLAWGVTYLKGDTSDYFIEDCRPGGETGWQYRRGDSWHDFQARSERIGRKSAASQSLTVYSNDVGTLETTPDADRPGLYLSTAWIGRESGAGRSIATWLELVAAADAESAMDLVRDCPTPTLHWVFADRAGHVGQQASGWFPKRPRGFSGLMPIPAWNPENHWRGRVSPDVLPRSYDPLGGYVSTANESVDRPGGVQLVTMFVPDYRKRRVDELLAQHAQARVEDFQAMQYDVVSLQARDLLAVFLPHVPPGKLRDRLQAWDCRYAPDSLGATWFMRLYTAVLLEVFGHEQGIGWRRMLYLCSRIGFSTMVLTAIDRLLLSERSFWWQGRDKGELVRRAAEHIAGEPDEPWSHVNRFHFSNRFLESRWLGRALGWHSGSLAMPGNHATIFQGHLLRTAHRETTFAPSYHFVTDLGTDEAWTNLPGGASESTRSPFYKNDLPRWLTGQYKRLGWE